MKVDRPARRVKEVLSVSPEREDHQVLPVRQVPKVLRVKQALSAPWDQQDHPEREGFLV